MGQKTEDVTIRVFPVDPVVVAVVSCSAVQYIYLFPVFLFSGRREGKQSEASSALLASFPSRGSCGLASFKLVLFAYLSRRLYWRRRKDGLQGGSRGKEKRDRERKAWLKGWRERGNSHAAFPPTLTCLQAGS